MKVISFLFGGWRRCRAAARDQQAHTLVARRARRVRCCRRCQIKRRTARKGGSEGRGGSIRRTCGEARAGSGCRTRTAHRIGAACGICRPPDGLVETAAALRFWQAAWQKARSTWPWSWPAHAVCSPACGSGIDMPAIAGMSAQQEAGRMSTCDAAACVQGRKTRAQTNAQSRQNVRNARMDWTGRDDEDGVLDVAHGLRNANRIRRSHTRSHYPNAGATPVNDAAQRPDAAGWIGACGPGGEPPRIHEHGRIPPRRQASAGPSAYLIAAWRLALAVISARAASTPAQPSVFTHLPASRSL